MFLRKVCLFALAATLGVFAAVETLNVVIKEYEVPTPKSRPHDPALAPDGSLWYTGQTANKLGRLDPKTGEFKEYPLKIPNSGPHGLVADKDVMILQTGGTSTRLSALHKRSVDATILTPEFFALAKKAGFTILADPTQYDIPFPQLEVITSRAFLKANADVATRYLRAIIEGIYMVKNNPEPSIRALGKYLKIDDREALEEVYRLYREIYPSVPHVSPAAIQTQLTWMAEKDPRAKAAKPEQFIDGTILKEIEKSGFVLKLYQK